MEKLYSVVVKKGVDLEQLDKELAASTGEGVIPSRPVSIGNPLVGNSRTTQWMLTLQEAEALKKDERILNVFLPPFEHYKILGSGTSAGKTVRPHDPSTDVDAYTNDVVDLDLQALHKADHYANGWDSKIVNWGLGRHQSFTDDHLKHTTEFYEQGSNGRDDWKRIGDVGTMSQLSTEDALQGIYGDTYDYGYDGEGVDIVIMDTGINPENPEWEDQDGVSRLQQIDWAQIATDNGYQLVDDDNTPLVQHPRHYEDFNGHGTHCASITAGKSHGFAKGADIYAFRLRNIANDGTDEEGYSWLQALTLLKIWHDNKGTGRPTILNMSLGIDLQFIDPPDFAEYRGEFLNNHPYELIDRLDANGAPIIDPETGDPEQIWNPTSSSILIGRESYAFEYGFKGQYVLNNSGQVAWGYRVNYRDAAIDAAVEDLIELGVHVCCAAGNNNFKLDIDADNPDYTMRNQQVAQTNVGADWNNKAYYLETSNNKWDAFYYNQPPTPAAAHPDVCVVGNISNDKFPQVDHYFDTVSGNPYVDGNGSVSTSTKTTLNPIEVKSYSSAHGNGVDLWAAGSEIIAGNPMRTLFRSNCSISTSLMGYDNYFYTTSPAFDPDLWAKDVHLHQLDDIESKNGLNFEYDTTSIAGKVRMYIRLDPDYVDLLVSKGIDSISSLRTYIHYDHLNPDFEDYHTIFASPERDSAGNLNSGIDYSTQYNYLTPAEETLYGADTTYSITSHDVDWGTDDIGQASSGTTRRIYTTSGSATYRTKTASKFLAFVERGCIFLQSVYDAYDPAYRDWAGESIDLTDPNVSDRVLFEITVPADQFTNQASNFESMFRCGGVIANVMHNRETMKLDAGWTYGALTEHYTGSALQVLSGTSMASPAVAGMMATHIERYGNKSPKEMIDHMSAPYSRSNRASLPESAQIGYDMTSISLDPAEPLVDSNDFHCPDPQWYQPNFPIFSDVAHNRAIVGNKTLAAPAHVERTAPEFTITGEHTHYSGTYEEESTINTTFPVDLSAIPPIAPISYVNIASGETWDVDLEMFGASNLDRQDGDWIPKELNSDLGSLSALTKIEEGKYRATFTNDLGLIGNNVPTVTFSGTMLKPIQDTDSKGVLPLKPSFVGDYSNIIVNEDNNQTDFFLVLPQVTTNSPTYTLVIKNELDSDSFYILPDNKTVYKSVALDYENYDNDNPLQFTMYAVDGWGQKSDEVTVSIIVIDTQDEPPSVSQFTASELVSLAADYTFTVDEHLSVSDLFSVGISDSDNEDSELDVRLKVYCNTPMTNLDGTQSAVVYDDTFDMSQLGLTFDKSDLSNVTLSLAAVDWEALPTGWNTSSKYIGGAVEVEDAQGHTAVKPFTIEINNIIEVNPILVSSTHTENDYSEFNNENAVIHTIQVTDQNDAPYSFIVDTSNHLAQMKSSSEYDVGYDNDYLSVNSQGQIYVNKALDYETADYAFLAVKVMNTYGNIVYHYTHLHLKDEIDQPPEFVDAFGSVINQDVVTFVEHPTVGTQLYSFQTDIPATFTVNKGEVQDGNGNVLTGEATSGVIVSDDRWDWRDYTTDTMVITATTTHGSTDLIVDPTVTQDASLVDLEIVQNFSNTSTANLFEVEHGTPAGTELFTISPNQAAYVADDTRYPTYTNMRWKLGDWFYVMPTLLGYQTYGDSITSGTNMSNGLNINGLEFDQATGKVFLVNSADINGRTVFEFDIIAYDSVIGTLIQNERIRIEVVQTDTDGDGTSDYFDAFPNDPSEDTDTDGDGVGDNADAFPNDPSESVDTDGDGVGDNTDEFPNDASETVDSDGDGVGDNADAFPNDPSESADTDGDGVGDNADAFPNDPNETVDTDGDGVGDNSDAYPNDPSESADTDGDGVGDNADAFPNDPTETVDADSDGVGANTDFDDNDPTVGIATDVTQTFKSFPVPLVSQSSAFTVERIPFDIGTASNRRLYIASNITTSTNYYNDVCIGGVQIQDENGVVLHDLPTSSYMTNYYWQTADQQAGNVSTPQVVGGQVPFNGVAMAQSYNKFCLLSQTTSTATGANDGIAASNHNFAWSHGQQFSQAANAYYLYREASSGSGYNFARTTSIYNMPSKGYICVAYHAATHSTMTASYNPNDTLYVGMY